MKDYKPTYPNPNHDDQPESEKQDGETARPSSLVAVHRPKVIDPLHELNLLRMMQVANERTVRELGPLPPGELPVQNKRKPTRPYTDFLGISVLEGQANIEKEDEMKLKEIVATATLVAGMVACDAAMSTTTAASPAETAAVAQAQEAALSNGRQDEDESEDMPKTYWQTFKPQFRESFDAQWHAAKTDEEKLAAIKEEFLYQDKLLDDRYKELHAILPDKRWRLLQDEQREWLVNDLKGCEPTVIVMKPIDVAYCKLFQTAVRASELDVVITLKRDHH